MKLLLSCLLAASASVCLSVKAAASAKPSELDRVLKECGEPTRTEKPTSAYGLTKHVLHYNQVTLQFTEYDPIPSNGINFARAGRGNSISSDVARVGQWLPCFEKAMSPPVSAPVATGATPPSTMGELFSPGHGITFLIIGSALYFLPALVAWYRRVEKRRGIDLVNLLLGWTVLGWVGALVWAVVGKTEAEARAAVIDYDRLAAAMDANRRDESLH